MKEHPGMRYRLTYVRIAVWGQAIVYLWQPISVAIRTSPDLLALVDPTDFIWPVYIITAMYLVRLDKFLAKTLSIWELSLFIFITSLGTTVATFVGASFYHDLPEGYFQMGWFSSQALANIGFMLALIALLANIVCLIKIYPKEKAESNQ
jgi:hypothetical protein